MKRKMSSFAPSILRLFSKAFIKSLPRNAWIALCKHLIAILEFNFKDWLYKQAYPPDRYARITPSSASAVGDGSDDFRISRYDRLA